MIVEWDFPKERPVARTPMPSVRTFIARDNTMDEVRSLAMGVPVRSLQQIAAGFTQIFLDRGVILQRNFAVFDNLLTLTIWAIHGLNSNHCNHSSSHSLRDQCHHLSSLCNTTEMWN